MDGRTTCTREAITASVALSLPAMIADFFGELEMDLTNKHILITGGSGFVGQHLIAGLRRRGVPREHIFAPRRAELDLRRWEDCQRAVAGKEVVIHLAAVVGGI